MIGIKQNTRNPIMNGGVCIGLAFDDGVIIAADNQASFGNMNKFEVDRVFKVNKKTIIGVGGDYADFQHVYKSIEQKQLEDESQMDGHCSGPLALHTWLTRLNYNKRSNMDPYWVEWIVGGMQDGKPFLGYVNRLGTSFQDRAIRTGRIGDIPLSLLREHTDANAKISEQKAREEVMMAMQVLHARDCFTSPTFYMAIVTKDKDASVEGPFHIKLDLSDAPNVVGYN